MKKVFLFLTVSLFLFGNSLIAQNWNEYLNAVASDAEASDHFGISVSISGDYAIVGAYGEDAGGSLSGAAYIFKNTSGTWAEVKKITASDAEASDYFGYSVSISGDYAIVGAYGEATGGTTSGAAYIYYKAQGGADNWGQVKKLTASDAAANDYFGYSVSISGNYAIVGASNSWGDADDTGAAYIYNKDQGGIDEWGEVQIIIASDPQGGDFFGEAVSISGDYVIVGAHKEDGGAGNPKIDAGAAYIFKNTSGTWAEITKITSSDAQSYDLFGRSVSISGNYVIVGAYNEDGGAGDPLSNAGAAYVYNKDQGGVDNWGEVQRIIASYPAAADYFGYSVSISGTYALVGAYQKANSYSAAGFAYLYSKDKDGTDNWGLEQRIGASDKEANDFFGKSVSISGSYAIVGADAKGSADKGAAYIFGNDDIVPVELISFSANIIANNVELNWQTATEVNNYGFEIERKNLDEIQSWETIGFIEGHGNSNSPKEYSFIDSDILKGKVQYRLKQIDTDGSFEYFSVIEVSLNSVNEYKLLQNYPNPFNPSTSIKYSITSGSNVKLIVYNVFGQEVRTLINEYQDSGNHESIFNASDLASGIYYIKLQVGDFHEIKKAILLK